MVVLRQIWLYEIIGVCYWCVKIPQCGYMEHGLKHFTFYVKKYIATLAMCYNSSLVRNKPLGAPAFVKLVCYLPLGLCMETVKQCKARKGHCSQVITQQTHGWFDGPTWGPSGADSTQVGPMLAPWTLLSGMVSPTQLFWRFHSLPVRQWHDVMVMSWLL